MLKTYRVTYVRMGIYRIEVFDDPETNGDYYLDSYNVEGACQLLDAMGYTCTEREYKEEE